MFNVVEIQSPLIGTKAFEVGGCSILVGIEDGLWHLSIAHPFHYPNWDIIKWVRYQFCPKNITMAMLLPPPEDYVNVHKNCFHLWQVQDDRGKKKSRILLK